MKALGIDDQLDKKSVGIVSLLLFFIIITSLRQGLFIQPRLANDPPTLFLNYLNARIMGVHHHDWKKSGVRTRTGTGNSSGISWF